MKIEIPDEISDAKGMYETTKNIAENLIGYFKGQLGRRAMEKLGPNKNPDFMTMGLLEKIVCVLPPSHISVEMHRGHARLFSSGTYKILQPIPQGMYLDACKKAGIFQ